MKHDQELDPTFLTDTIYLFVEQVVLKYWSSVGVPYDCCEEQTFRFRFNDFIRKEYPNGLYVTYETSDPFPICTAYEIARQMGGTVFHGDVKELLHCLIIKASHDEILLFIGSGNVHTVKISDLI